MRSDRISGIIKWYSVHVSSQKVDYVATLKGIYLKIEVFINFYNFLLEFLHNWPKCLLKLHFYYLCTVILANKQ